MTHEQDTNRMTGIKMFATATTSRREEKNKNSSFITWIYFQVSDGFSETKS